MEKQLVFTSTGVVEVKDIRHPSTPQNLYKVREKKKLTAGFTDKLESRSDTLLIHTAQKYTSTQTQDFLEKHPWLHHHSWLPVTRFCFHPWTAAAQRLQDTHTHTRPWTHPVPQTFSLDVWASFFTTRTSESAQQTCMWRGVCVCVCRVETLTGPEVLPWRMTSQHLQVFFWLTVFPFALSLSPTFS